MGGHLRDQKAASQKALALTFLLMFGLRWWIQRSLHCLLLRRASGAEANLEFQSRATQHHLPSP